MVPRQTYSLIFVTLLSGLSSLFELYAQIFGAPCILLPRHDHSILYHDISYNRLSLLCLQVNIQYHGDINHQNLLIHMLLTAFLRCLEMYRGAIPAGSISSYHCNYQKMCVRKSPDRHIQQLPSLSNVRILAFLQISTSSDRTKWYIYSTPHPRKQCRF